MLYSFPTFGTDPGYLQGLLASWKEWDRDLPEISKPQTSKVGLLLQLSIRPNEYTSGMQGETWLHK